MGWSWRTLGSLLEQRKRKAAPSEVLPKTPLVGLEHLPRRRLTLENWARAEDVGSPKTLFEPGDVLFSMIRPYFHKVSVAPISGVCSTNALALVPDDSHRGQAIMALSSDEVIAHATQTSNGTTMPRVNWDVVAELQVAVPPSALAERFSVLVDEILSTCQRLMFSTRSLSEIRNALLPRLVTGQVDVSDLDLDGIVEKASF